MSAPLYERFTPATYIFLALLFALAGLLIFAGLGLVAASLLFPGVGTAELLNPCLTTPQGVGMLRVMQMFYTTGLFIFPAVVLGLFFSGGAGQFLGFRRPSASFALLASILILVALPGINLLASLNAGIPVPEWMLDMELRARELTQAFLVEPDPWMLPINFTMVAVLPSIGEELLFRGVLQPQVCRLVRSSFWGVFIVSAFFSLLHFQFQGFIPRLLLGMLFGYLFIWSGSIWAPMLAHLVNNGVAVVAFFLIARGAIPPQVETVGQLGQLWPLGIASLALAGSLILLLWRERVRSAAS